MEFKAVYYIKHLNGWISPMGAYKPDMEIYQLLIDGQYWAFRHNGPCKIDPSIGKRFGSALYWSPFDSHRYIAIVHFDGWLDINDREKWAKYKGYEL